MKWINNKNRSLIDIENIFFFSHMYVNVYVPLSIYVHNGIYICSPPEYARMMHAKRNVPSKMRKQLNYNWTKEQRGWGWQASSDCLPFLKIICIYELNVLYWAYLNTFNKLLNTLMNILYKLIGRSCFSSASFCMNICIKYSVDFIQTIFVHARLATNFNLLGFNNTHSDNNQIKCFFAVFSLFFSAVVEYITYGSQKVKANTQKRRNSFCRVWLNKFIKRQTISVTKAKMINDTD